ncbi:enhancer of mRNA-decapping protein 3-like [Tubulanus polymorphus]|uniref:enhancer of mRNA-decapping protein 3-like n=1 Tax=Tubulanus polymorphus TaxID=672921 RepID=UPI003DA5FB1F
MSEYYIGKSVSIDCGDVLGTYQGFVSQVDKEQQTLSIIKAYRNGISCQVPSITISAADIKALNMIDTGPVPSAYCNPPPTQTTSTTKPTTPRKKKDENERREEFGRRRSNSYSASEHNEKVPTRRSATTPKKIDQRQHQQQKQRGEVKDDCFSAPVESFLEEFDFEKNLALFDKQAIFEEIENNMKPDVVRNTDKRAPTKYRCDENVLPSGPVIYQQIKIPQQFIADKQYVTDRGLVVPSITYSMKVKIQQTAERFGFVAQRQLEALGRSTAEMVLQLIGGSHRLNPQNSHQRPSVVILCGSHIQGAQAVNCARHLMNRSVNTTVFIPESSLVRSLADELHLYNVSDGKKVSTVSELPTTPVDIIVNAIDSQDQPHNQTQNWYKAMVNWSNESKAPVLALDPPATGTTIDTKWSITSILPLSFTDSCGQVYLCDVGYPNKIFNEVGIKYMAPFGSKFYIPLHLKK